MVKSSESVYGGGKSDRNDGSVGDSSGHDCYHRYYHYNYESDDDDDNGDDHSHNYCLYHYSYN